MEAFEHRQKYEIFLARLKRARVEAGLTQQQVAKLLGKPQSYIAKCEAGERRIDLIELLEFARIYGKPVTYFADNVTLGPNQKDKG